MVGQSIHRQLIAVEPLKLLMDAIFGVKYIQRECIWNIAVLSGFKTQARNWIRGHDTLFYYSRSARFTFNRQRLPHSQKYLDRFKKIDTDGRKYFDGRGKKIYLDDVVKKGKAVGDVWSDIVSFQQIPTSKERLTKEVGVFYTGHHTAWIFLNAPT